MSVMSQLARCHGAKGPNRWSVSCFQKLSFILKFFQSQWCLTWESSDGNGPTVPLISSLCCIDKVCVAVVCSSSLMLSRRSLHRTHEWIVCTCGWMLMSFDLSVAVFHSGIWHSHGPNRQNVSATFGCFTIKQNWTSRLQSHLEYLLLEPNAIFQMEDGGGFYCHLRVPVTLSFSLSYKINPLSDIYTLYTRILILIRLP